MRALLQQRDRVADDQTVFVLVALTRNVVAPHGVFPGEAQVFQRTFLYYVRQGQVAFPLGTATTGYRVSSGVGDSVDVVTTQVNDAGSSAWQANLGEVIRVASLPGTFAGTGKLGDLAVGNYVG